ncbi:MAG TPA: YihY/virulence factor BrkB family protein [Burkholderiales bacterium]|nr:YihY/virulence factor BrkB family protein [Burkholderiales bacterium]
MALQAPFVDRGIDGQRAAEHGHGRMADQPQQIPARGWRDIAWRVKDSLLEDHLSIISAGVAFYLLLAVFPGIAVVVSLYGLFFDVGQVSAQLEGFRGVVPPEALELMLGQLTEVASQDGSSLGLAAAGALLLTLWSASTGVKTLIEALNLAYKEDERRGFFRLNALALLLTVAGILATIVGIAAIVALPVVVDFLGLGGPVATLFMLGRWPLLAIAMLFALGIMYRYGPSRRPARWLWVSPGAVVATVLWLVGSELFSYYASHFGNYNKTYGSVGAVVILLMWFLLTAYLILVGAEINAEVERQTARDTTDGRPRPLGQRGAYAADTVGPAVNQR